MYLLSIHHIFIYARKVVNYWLKHALFVQKYKMGKIKVTQTSVVRLYRFAILSRFL